MSVEVKVKQYLDKIKKEDRKINSFLELNQSLIEEARAIDAKKKKGKLAGVVIAVKSNINVKGLKASCASKTLESYKSSYDATVIERIKKEDGVIIGMTNCDEFACGWSGENSAFGATENPAALGFVPGGSSSGSAAAVAAGFCDVALGSDTGGSIRVPASCCGVVGLKPSYGAVSRYGLIDLSMSLDQIGTIARDVESAEKVFEVISGRDERDSRSFDRKSKEKNVDRIGIMKMAGVNSEVQSFVDEFVDKLTRKLKLSSEVVEINGSELGIEAYHPIVWTEFFSASRRLDGRRYGIKIEESAGEEVLRRIFGGSEISKAEFKGRYYQKALGVKNKIKDSFNQVFRSVDCIICPTMPILPWKRNTRPKAEDLFIVDMLTIPANLGGVCAMSLPIGKLNGLPVGMQIICASGEEKRLFEFAKKVEGFSD
ncbi:MAG: amidase family protein [Nanoarchaeota archaeon]